MAVVAIYSVKGGVGKTTLAVDFAWRCASFGMMPTLIWDLDPQGGSAFLLDVPPPRRTRAVGVFQREGRPRELIQPTKYANLSILPADESLRDTLIDLGNYADIALMVLDGTWGLPMEEDNPKDFVEKDPYR